MFCCTPAYNNPTSWIFPGLFLALVAWGLFSLYRNRHAPAHDALTSPCASCGALLRDDWQNCPKCGKSK